MDDIFSDFRDDSAQEKDANIEWKKNGTDKHERLTLKINVREANLYQAAKANDLKSKTKPKNPLEVPRGFKKVSKKIRDALDEEEDEDDYIIVPVFEDMYESSLLQALNEDEKKILRQNENINTVRLQENAGREAAVEHAEKVIMQAGFKRPDGKVLNEARQRPGIAAADEIISRAVKKKTPERKSFAEGKKQKNTEDSAKRKAEKSRLARTEKENAEAREKIKESANAKKGQTDIGRPTQEKTIETLLAETETTPQYVKAEEPAKEEPVSVKAEEKAPVEYKEAEISSVKTEDKTPEKNDKGEAEKIKQAENEAVFEEKELLRENSRTNEKAEQSKMQSEEGVKRVVKEIVAEEKQSLAAALPDEKENKKDVKDVIMEKSGRTYNERNVVKQAEKLPAPEKEIRPEVEEQLKKYRENER